MPLGSVLSEYKIQHTSRPKAFLRLSAPDAFICEALELKTGAHSALSVAAIRSSIPSNGRWPKSSRILPPAPADVEDLWPHNFEVLIIGAGPAGSSAAAILAEHGHRVLILEREKFPRYHVGESLLPFTYQPLERLGLIDKMRQSAFVKKYSVQFVGASGKASQPFYFFNRYDRETVAQTWQVLRSEFDQMLLDNARSQGAEVLEETTVTSLIKEGDRVVGVRARTGQKTEKEYCAPMVMDCSGKEAFAAVRQQWRIKDPFLNKVAVWTYYKGALRDAGIDEGDHHRGHGAGERLVLVHPSAR